MGVRALMDTIRRKAFAQVASRMSLVLLALSFVLLPAPGVASAHAQVQSSNPPNGATVAPGMTQVTVIFTEEISPGQSSAQLVGPAGVITSGVAVSVNRAERNRMTIATPPRGAGKHSVKGACDTENQH